MFCQSCGAKVDMVHASPEIRQTQSGAQSQSSSNNSYAPGGEVGTSIGLLTKIIALPLLTKTIAGIVVFVFIITISMTAATNAGRDLSGTYSTCTFFPVSRITFSTDGTFTAYNDIETLQGKYSKNGNTYSLRFTGGQSRGGSSVDNFRSNSADSLYELEATKVSESHLRLSVVPKIGYRAWLGTTVDFYR